LWGQNLKCKVSFFTSLYLPENFYEEFKLVQLEQCCQLLWTNFQLKNSAAGENIRPHMRINNRLILLPFCKTNGWEKLSKQGDSYIFCVDSMCILEKQNYRKIGLFSAFIGKNFGYGFFRSHNVFSYPFCVLRPKFWPLGSTEMEFYQ
jgi:hypothetical protein